MRVIFSSVWLPIFSPDRDDQPAADRELLLQRLRHLGPAGRDQDGIERRGLRPAFGAVADAQLDIVVAQLLEPSPGRLGQRRMALDRVDPVGDLAHHGRGVARAGAHLEHAVAGLHLGGLDHQRDDVGLRDRLALADRQRPVLVGELLEAGLDEGLARHAAHGVQDVAVAHAAPGDLDVHHPGAGAGEVEHRKLAPFRS